MSKKRFGKEEKSSFRMLYDPYGVEDTKEIFQRYENDKNAIIDIEDKVFYRALQIFIMNYGKEKLIAFLDNQLNLKISDKVIDDNNNTYTVKGFAFIRFSCDIPDWYLKASFVELSGDYDNIGHYFARI